MSELTEKTHRVTYAVGWTANMGNFESLRVDLGLELDGVGNPDATLNKVAKWVEENLGARVVEVRKQIEESKAD